MPAMATRGRSALYGALLNEKGSAKKKLKKRRNEGKTKEIMADHRLQIVSIVVVESLCLVGLGLWACLATVHEAVRTCRYSPYPGRNRAEDGVCP